MSLDREKLSDRNSFVCEDNYCNRASLYQNQVPNENSSDDEDDQSQVSLNQDKLSDQNSDSNEDVKYLKMKMICQIKTVKKKIMAIKWQSAVMKIMHLIE